MEGSWATGFRAPGSLTSGASGQTGLCHSGSGWGGSLGAPGSSYRHCGDSFLNNYSDSRRTVGSCGGSGKYEDPYLQNLLNRGRAPGYGLGDTTEPSNARGSADRGQPTRPGPNRSGGQGFSGSQMMSGPSVSRDGQRGPCNTQAAFEAADIRVRLGDDAFYEMRTLLLTHKEAFMQQLFELHRMAGLQKHLVAVCEQPARLRAEVQFLEQEAAQRMRPREHYQNPRPASSSQRPFQHSPRVQISAPGAASDEEDPAEAVCVPDVAGSCAQGSSPAVRQTGRSLY